MSGSPRKAPSGGVTYKVFGSGGMKPLVKMEQPLIHADPVKPEPVRQEPDRRAPVNQELVGLDHSPMAGGQVVIPVCTRTFHQNACVDAELVVRPSVSCRPVAVRCLEGGIGSCFGTPALECATRVFQVICAEFELSVGADAFCRDPRISCENGAVAGPCLLGD